MGQKAPGFQAGDQGLLKPPRQDATLAVSFDSRPGASWRGATTPSSPRLSSGEMSHTDVGVSKRAAPAESAGAALCSPLLNSRAWLPVGRKDQLADYPDADVTSGRRPSALVILAVRWLRPRPSPADLQRSPAVPEYLAAAWYAAALRGTCPRGFDRWLAGSA